MKFLNGFKTYIGFATLVLSALVEHESLLPVDWRPYLPLVKGAAAMLASLGVIHKFEKSNAGGQ